MEENHPPVMFLSSSRPLYIVSAAVICAVSSVGDTSVSLSDQENITAELGDSVTLNCRTFTSNLAAVEWIRPDLEPTYVFFYRKNEQPDLENQHPSFTNRVKLVDREMKDGNVSLILRNVTSNDTGTYECHIIARTRRSSFGTNPIKTIHLYISQPGHKAGNDEREDKGGGNTYLVAIVLSIVGVGFGVGFCLCKKYGR